MPSLVRRASLVLALATATMAGGAFAQSSMMSHEKTVMVGGAAMYPSKNIVENAVNSKDHTTLATAVKAAGLVDTLEVPALSRSSHQPTKRSRCCRQARSTPC